MPKSPASPTRTSTKKYPHHQQQQPQPQHRRAIVLISSGCLLLGLSFASSYKEIHSLSRSLAKSVSEVTDGSLRQLQSEWDEYITTTSTTTTSMDTATTNRLDPQLDGTYNTSSSDNPGMAACLLVLEDSIRLTEWIAYHYTTMPLRSLIIALDPKNSPSAIQRIVALQDRWSHFGLRIRLWKNDTFVERNDIREWLLGTRGGSNPYRTYPRLKHDERQCQFMSQWYVCFLLKIVHGPTH